MVVAVAFEVGGDIASDDLKNIADGLDAHSLENVGFVWEPFNIIARDNGKMIAGLTGFVAGAVALVKYLWVGKKYRGAGLGRELMNRVDILVKERNCKVIRVDTFSYQAPEFYKKMGYTLGATIPGYFEGQDRFFFEKKVG